MKNEDTSTVASSRRGSNSGKVSEADIEQFGAEKFRNLRRQYGKKYALQEVARYQAQAAVNTSQDEEVDEDDDEFGIEDTDLWVTQSSVECVLGGI